MKTEKFSVTVPKDVIQRVKEAAKSENRSVSNMATVLLIEALKNKAA